MLIHLFHFVFGILHSPVSKQLLPDFNFCFIQLRMFSEGCTELRVQQDAATIEIWRIGKIDEMVRYSKVPKITVPWIYI